MLTIKSIGKEFVEFQRKAIQRWGNAKTISLEIATLAATTLITYLFYKAFTSPKGPSEKSPPLTQRVSPSPSDFSIKDPNISIVGEKLANLIGVSPPRRLPGESDSVAISNWINRHQTALDTLKELNLSTSGLTAVPDVMGQLRSLTSINLSGNQLTTLPSCMSNLTSLTLLELSTNLFTSMPEVIGKLSSLIMLECVNNQLSSIPDFVGNLTLLASLNLSGNKITLVPDTIKLPTQLEILDLSGNPLVTPLDAIRQKIPSIKQY